MKRAILVSAVAVAGFIALVYFMRASEPFTTIYGYLVPLAEQAIDIIQKNVVVVLGAVGSIFGTILTVVTRRKDAIAASAAAKADNYIDNLTAKLAETTQTAEQKITGLLTENQTLTTQRDKLHNDFVETSDNVTTLTSNLTEANALLASSNKMKEDLKKQVETLNQKILQMQGKETYAYQP
jgi:phage shock protein A